MTPSERFLPTPSQAEGSQETWAWLQSQKTARRLPKVVPSGWEASTESRAWIAKKTSAGLQRGSVLLTPLQGQLTPVLSLSTIRWVKPTLSSSSKVTFLHNSCRSTPELMTAHVVFLSMSNQLNCDRAVSSFPTTLQIRKGARKVGQHSHHLYCLHHGHAPTIEDSLAIGVDFSLIKMEEEEEDHLWDTPPPCDWSRLMLKIELTKSLIIVPLGMIEDIAPPDGLMGIRDEDGRIR
ncbi:uncharacterized protein FOMMEDRAFT_160461 [Fomitiporia mediterranea MF3/22]|uniref:uncharacterized protein n=1 Tax=Fomitiporia mediterranea (strain MF3/22) TaxID=694068 RepID=UPI0004408D3C|nr:uncharacterized protein FOMMEDRAFT_160461 [Fomitiporia mediterranea MF3/22]EJC99421.1 hypothetical protein FOMMEDRAFT_160461 [Fomitiporia mediterranea MF3/22]